MKVSIHAVGRMKAGPDKDLADRYLERFARGGPTLGLDFAGVSEIAESRLATVDARRREEATPVLAALDDGALLVLLDERGRNLSSQRLADQLAAMRDDGARHLLLAIGGPDGHDPALSARAKIVLSFGALTWPHQLARIMLAEQLYRVTTILSGHPYHRA